MEKLKVLEFVDLDEETVLSPLTFYLQDCKSWGKNAGDDYESNIGVTWVKMDDGEIHIIEMDYYAFDRIMDKFNKSILKFN